MLFHLLPDAEMHLVGEAIVSYGNTVVMLRSTRQDLVERATRRSGELAEFFGVDFGHIEEHLASMGLELIGLPGCVVEFDPMCHEVPGDFGTEGQLVTIRQSGVRYINPFGEWCTWRPARVEAPTRRE